MPSTDPNFFYQNLIFVAENQVYKQRDEVCNDVILMPQFLKVVRNIFQVWWATFYIVANLTAFPAVEEFSKLVKIRLNYRHNK